MSAARSRTSRKPRSARNAMIAKVKIGQMKLGWDDATYRGILQDRYGQDSAAKLQEHQLDDLIGHMKRHGFRPVAKARKKPAQRMADSPLARKIRALWLSLYHLGEVEDSSEAALLAFAQRVTKRDTADGAGVQALQWITDEQAWQVIEALKKWADRAGIRWSDFPSERIAVIQAQWRRLKAQCPDLQKMGAFNQSLAEITGKMSPTACSDGELDLVIKELGRQIREAKHG